MPQTMPVWNYSWTDTDPASAELLVVLACLLNTQKQDCPTKFIIRVITMKCHDLGGESDKNTYWGKDSFSLLN